MSSASCSSGVTPGSIDRQPLIWNPPITTGTPRALKRCFFCKGYGDHRDLHSFPTRRSSDLEFPNRLRISAAMAAEQHCGAGHFMILDGGSGADRKSTRLNSSHVRTSYAVFCLKKKKKKEKRFKIKKKKKNKKKI